MRIELTTRLDRSCLDEILELIETTAKLEGHRPVGEHKYAHLSVGATGWTGVLARDDDGTLIGYVHTRWNEPDAEPRVAVEVVVHPQHRDDGRVAAALLAETRAVVARGGGGTLWLWVHRVEDPQATLAAELGFTVQRELAFMTRRLDDAPDHVTTPQGVEIRPYRSGADDAELLRVNNAAFEGHPENGDWDQRELEHRRSLPWFVAEDVLLAWRGDTLLGFHWTKWHGHDSEEMPAHEPVGEVYILAVDPAMQGSGLGRTLLAAGLAHLRARGCTIAVLYVDRASVGALRLYESAGFAVEYHEVCYEQWVPPEPDTSRVELRHPAP